jgi:hypothetical protein
MPNIIEFFGSKTEESVDSRVEKIDQQRPCSKCELHAPYYSFNQVTLEMHWKCPSGHETKHKLN